MSSKRLFCRTMAFLTITRADTDDEGALRSLTLTLTLTLTHQTMQTKTVLRKTVLRETVLTAQY